MVSIKTIIVMALLLVGMAAALPYASPAALPDGYQKEQLGRVKMQVYRGPSKGEGYHVFAPWGYYVQQPEDYKKYHH